MLAQEDSEILNKIEIVGALKFIFRLCKLVYLHFKTFGKKKIKIIFKNIYVKNALKLEFF